MFPDPGRVRTSWGYVGETRIIKGEDGKGGCPTVLCHPCRTPKCQASIIEIHAKLLYSKQ
jgi:hypothetical protein